MKSDSSVCSIEVLSLSRNEVEEIYSLEIDSLKAYTQANDSQSHINSTTCSTNVGGVQDNGDKTLPVVQHTRRKQGVVVSVDLLEFDAVAGASSLVGDFRCRSVRDRVSQLIGGEADVVLCDMAPSFSGIAGADHSRQLSLARHALRFALLCLKPLVLVGAGTARNAGDTTCISSASATNDNGSEARQTSSTTTKKKKNRQMQKPNKAQVERLLSSVNGGRCGVFVTKVLRGGEEAEFRKLLNAVFYDVKLLKPEASRKDSAELFYCCRGVKPAMVDADSPPVVDLL